LWLQLALNHSTDEPTHPPTNRNRNERRTTQEFTFTLTQGDGTRVQGFCRRFLPPAPRVGSRLRYPQVLCLVCEASWAALFFKVSALRTPLVHCFEGEGRDEKC